jgi:hypothetical protein
MAECVEEFGGHVVWMPNPRRRCAMKYRAQVSLCSTVPVYTPGVTTTSAIHAAPLLLKAVQSARCWPWVTQ